MKNLSRITFRASHFSPTPMPPSFHTRISQSLANPDLQIALDGNNRRRLSGRNTAFASLHDPEALRQQARAVRADVIANLDAYLDQFVANAQANGITVHRAADAAQARQIVLDICQRAATSKPANLQPATCLVAKSKSMVSEEIHLNPFIEAAGIRVVETDLGEYIIQLRGEPPAHLITPAVHLRKEQVGQLFHEKLGVPYTDDIPTMTNTARRMLREVFMTADVGISGVNFGVAESGMLALVTNEGNGRMVTTLPRVHIALMGMERLVPTFDDLALMLQLLPRSATGQKLSVYTSLMHGPRRPGENEGPLERHLILLDNGRSALRQSPLAEALYCIRCGACLNACPVFRELGGHAYVSIHGEHAAYPGPIGSVLSPALFGADEYGHLARASSLCGACKDICPVEIDLPKLLLRVRAGKVAPAGKKAIEQPAQAVAAPPTLAWGLRAFAFAASHPWLYRLAQRLAGLGSRLVSPRSAWIKLPAFTGWGFSKDFPRPALTPFLARPNNPWHRINPVLHRQTPEAVTPYTETATQEGLVTQFTRELMALGGEVICCTAGELNESVLTLLKELRVERIQAWDGSALPAGLLDAVHAAGIETSTAYDPGIKVGLTGALAGIAETGTLALMGTPGRPLTASLVPEIHLAIVRQADIKENLAQVLALSEIRHAGLAALITGPSRTGDIEMALTIGVHGPGQIHVFCVEA
jgi:L-lactate dehydrogenase complex protein LldF